MIGEATEVPNAHWFGSPLLFEQAPKLLLHHVYACPHGPWAASSDTSGRSRTPSFGMPNTPVCQTGFGYRAQVPLTTPVMDGVPAAQPLGPPPPPHGSSRAPTLPALLHEPAEP